MKAAAIGDPTKVNTVNMKNDFWHVNRYILGEIQFYYVADKIKLI